MHVSAVQMIMTYKCSAEYVNLIHVQHDSVYLILHGCAGSQEERPRRDLRATYSSMSIVKLKSPIFVVKRRLQFESSLNSSTTGFRSSLSSKCTANTSSCRSNRFELLYLNLQIKKINSGNCYKNIQ